MSEVFQTSELAYRICILYEAVRKTPVEEAYKNMREVKSNIDFLDFEYWYYRFFNGQHDLNHDRSKDPKTRGLSDMPIGIVESIIANLSLADKISTRNTSKSLRAVVDSYITKFDEVRMKISYKASEVQFDTQKTEYSGQKNGEHWKRAIKEFASVMNDSNLRFKNLSIKFDAETDRELNDKLYPPCYDASKSLQFLNSHLSNHDIDVKNLNITASTFKAIAVLFPHLNSNVLDSLDFRYSIGFELDKEGADEETFEEIVTMDQWKNLKRVKLLSVLDPFPIEVLFHLKSFEVWFDFEQDHLPKIRDILLNSSTFESCSLFYDEGTIDEERLLLETDRVMGAHTAYNSRNRRYRIDGSNDYFEFSCLRDSHDEMYLLIERIRV
ncbi:unnamed protein product [Caenorhabditis brenneri]